MRDYFNSIVDIADSIKATGNFMNTISRFMEEITQLLSTFDDFELNPVDLSVLWT